MGILDNLPHTATAKVRTRTIDTLGASVDTWTNVFEDRACWQQAASEREITEFSKRGISVTTKIYFTTDPELDETHVIDVNDGTYEVRSRSKPDASAGMGIVWRVYAEETTTGST